MILDMEIMRTIFMGVAHSKKITLGPSYFSFNHLPKAIQDYPR